MKITITEGNEIKRTLECHPNFAQDQALDGEKAHVGEYLPELHTYDDSTETFTTIEGAEKPIMALETPQLLNAALVDLKGSDAAMEMFYKDMRTKAEAKNLIDLAGNKHKKKVVSLGHLIISEYEIAARQVKEWRAQGSDPNNAPRSINDEWVTVKGITPEEAAQEIEYMESVWEEFQLDIRNLRQIGKILVDRASMDDYKDVARLYISKIEELPLPNTN